MSCNEGFGGLGGKSDPFDEFPYGEDGIRGQYLTFSD
jgi:hypothetical protein